MSSQLRIPKLVAISLVFGACGSDGGGSDVSSSRATKLAEDYCRQWAECKPHNFELEHAGVSECAAFLKGALTDYTEVESKECAAAVFDSFECEGTLLCEATEEDEEKCEKLSDRAEEKCADEDDAYSANRVRRTSRALRIPR